MAKDVGVGGVWLMDGAEDRRAVVGRGLEEDGARMRIVDEGDMLAAV